MTEDEILSQQAEQALQDAANRVVDEARRTHGSVIVWENGAVREIPWDQLPPATAAEEKDVAAE
jgi:hypothetical protein